MLRAFDQSVGYADVVIVNVAVALFAGLVPVPGVTFYTPPLFGARAFHTLQRQHFP